jgi:hypothetical protein
MHAGSNLLHSTEQKEGQRAPPPKKERHVGLKNIMLKMSGFDRYK